MAREQSEQPREKSGTGGQGQAGQQMTEMRCPSCAQRFTSEQQLREHQRSMHRDQSRS
jgi:hypothetical protein